MTRPMRLAVAPAVAIAAIGLTVSACRPAAQVTRLQARPIATTTTIDPGAHPLGLGQPRLRDVSWRDGTLYVPTVARDRRVPLLVLLHGGGGRAHDFHDVFSPLVNEFGVAIVTLDSRDNTWDGIDSPYGPDVLSIDAALTHVFDRVAIDPGRIALGGLSDGASYALSVGLANGDLFTHLVAVAPGIYDTPAPPAGRPRIFVGHGVRDNVYSVRLSRHITVPRLSEGGYDVTFVEFDGPHWVTPEAARRALEWLTR
jgi:phospholipase/carboxylesterase